MEEWLNIPQLTLKGLKFHPSADTYYLLDLHLTATRRLNQRHISEECLCAVAKQQHTEEITKKRNKNFKHFGSINFVPANFVNFNIISLLHKPFVISAL